MMMVGQKVRELRKRLGMPAYVLAKRVGTSPNTIWLLEVHEIIPRRAVCERIAEILGVGYEELFSREQEVSQP